MKCAYEAANGVEAHMVAHLLEQHSISVRIDGEHLAGAVGELPAAGLVRVMVEEGDLERARQIIREWETKSPKESSPANQAPTRSFGPVWFVAGIAVTVATLSWLSRPSATPQGVDFNNDGRLDEHYAVANGRIVKVEGDANLDGRIDYVYRYSDAGRPESSEMDLNFDGVFELKQAFERSNAKRVDIDWDMDGHVDRREDYSNGVLSTVTFFAPRGDRVVKRERFGGGLLIDAELDSDGDGVLETLYRYDRYGEITEALRR